MAPSQVSLVPHYTTPEEEQGPPLWRASFAPEAHEVHHPSPGPFVAKTRMEQAFLYLAAGIIVVPNIALSWPPMTIAVILGSALAVLCGFRVAVAIPVFMLLNPASPLWRDRYASQQGGLVLTPRQICRTRHDHRTSNRSVSDSEGGVCSQLTM